MNICEDPTNNPTNNPHNLTMDDYKVILKDSILQTINITIIPEDIIINTLTVCCALDVLFNVTNIARYIDLHPDAIIKINHGDPSNILTNRSIIVKKKNKKPKKKKKVFYNQVSLCVIVTDKIKPVNVKLFSNGSIQMTGCKVIDNAIDALYKLFLELQKIKAVIDGNTMSIIDKPFFELIIDRNELSKTAITPIIAKNTMNLYNVNRLRIEMIVCKFKYPTLINRNKLFRILKESNYECSYNPEKHAAVDLKFNTLDRNVSIFIFEKGSIVITGAKTCNQIINAYNFINILLLKNHLEIEKKISSNIENYISEDKKITI
jgi:TATA-box binding protein (TBP) (component of TFIID and TFIIIB)